MTIFKDTSNQVHEIEEGFEHLLPVGCIEITQAEADSLRTPSAEEIEQKRIADIQAEAQARIIAKLPEGRPDNFIIKELNLLMLDNELNDILLQGGTLTVEQESQKVFFRGLKDKIKAIRDMSNIAEAGGHSTDKFKSDLDLAGL